MKKPITRITVLLLLFTFSLSASTKNIANNNTEKKKVLVVSFIKMNFMSTYMTYEVAEKNNTDSDTVINLLDDKIFSSFPKTEKIEFLKCSPDKIKQIETSLSFTNNKKDILIPDLSKIENSSFNKLLEAYDADYIVFINGYEMNWIGDPQYKVKNSIHFSILGKNKKEIATNKYGFSIPKLYSFKKMEKKIRKVTTKIYLKHFTKII